MVSQKCTIEYCRAKAGTFWDKLFGEPSFQAALGVCHWEGYAAVLADVVVVAEGYLRPHAPDLPRLSGWLTEAFSAGLATYPVPAHRPEGWGDVEQALRLRLAAVQLSPVQPVHLVGQTSGNRIFEVLPIHPSLRRDDRELVRNNVRFGLCRSYEDMKQRVDPARVVRVLEASANSVAS